MRGGAFYFDELVARSAYRVGLSPAFRFDVIQRSGEVTPDGRPVNQATLVLSLRTEIPANLKSVVSAMPDGSISVVPDLHPVVTLSVPVTANDGSVHTESTQGVVTPQSGSQALRRNGPVAKPILRR